MSVSKVKVTIEFDTTGAEFEDDMCLAIRRTIRDAGRRVAVAIDPEPAVLSWRKAIMDINGNSIGHLEWLVELDED